MRRATVHVDLANLSCVVTSRRRFYGAWGPNITRRTAEAAIAADGWRFTKNSTWVMTINGGTREVERPGVLLQLAAQIRDRLAARISDRLLDNLGSATPEANSRLGALLLAWRHETEAQPIPPLVDTPTAIDTIQKGAAE